MTLQIFATPAGPKADGTEIRLYLGPEESVRRASTESAREESICLGTIHAGEWLRLMEMGDEDTDSATFNQIAYCTERIRSMIEAHGLEPATENLNETWRQVDELARSFLEPGPPWHTTVAVRPREGAAEPRLTV